MDVLKVMTSQGEVTGINLSLYPPISQIYDELLQAAVLLLRQTDDPDYPAFANRMATFCDIV